MKREVWGEPSCDVKTRTAPLVVAFIFFVDRSQGGGGGLAAIFDLDAFCQAILAPVKKTVNHSKTVISMREMRMIRVILSVENELAFSLCLFAVSMFFCGSTKFEHDYFKSRPME